MNTLCGGGIARHLAHLFHSNILYHSKQIGASEIERNYFVSKVLSSEIENGFDPVKDILSEEAISYLKEQREKSTWIDYEYVLETRLKCLEGLFFAIRRGETVYAFALAEGLKEYSRIWSGWRFWGAKNDINHNYQRRLSDMFTVVTTEAPEIMQKAFHIAMKESENTKTLIEWAEKVKLSTSIDLLADEAAKKGESRRSRRARFSEIVEAVLNGDGTAHAARATGSELVNERDRERLERIAKEGKTEAQRREAREKLKILDTRAADSKVEKVKSKGKKR